MHVGVFLRQQAIDALKAESSPCMWGCFRNHSKLRDALVVFPMHVGVFPHAERFRLIDVGLPHACGGVSNCQ